MMSRNLPPHSSSSSSESMSDNEMDMMDLETERERALANNAAQTSDVRQRTPQQAETLADTSAVEQALNLMTLSSTNRSPPRLSTEEELLELEDAGEALRAGNESSLSAQVHLEKARRVWRGMGHIVNVDLLGAEEKLEVDGRYARAEQHLAAAAQIQNMAAVWLRNERARLREMMK
ncbi:MAG: hypothetical protein M1836_000377 [Candelina mexicana]|nr:MAG: hypothetical protein M1836_000377 [Candelina mexicana]